MRIVKKIGEFTLNEVRKICSYCNQNDDEAFKCPFLGCEVVACTNVKKGQEDYSEEVEVLLYE